MAEQKNIRKMKPDVFSRSSQAVNSVPNAPSKHTLRDNYFIKERNKPYG